MKIAFYIFLSILHLGLLGFNVLIALKILFQNGRKIFLLINAALILLSVVSIYSFLWTIQYELEWTCNTVESKTKWTTVESTVCTKGI